MESFALQTNLQKYSSHISTLERENMVLLNEVKKLEAQVGTVTAAGDGVTLDSQTSLIN